MKNLLKLLTITAMLLALIGAFVTLSASAVEDNGEDAAAPTEIAVTYPEITAITPDASGFTVKWTAYPGAVKYRLFVRGASGWNRVGDTAALSLRHTGLTDLTSYRYTVRALDARGRYMSDYLVSGWSAVYRSAPELTSVAASGNALRITWKSMPGVECYRVYRKEGTGWVGIGFADTATFTDEQVVSGRSYTYTVRAFDADRRTILSGYQTAGKTAAFVSMPIITGLEARNAGVRITWGKVDGAATYRVFIKSTNGWKRIGDTTGVYFDYSGAPKGVASTYTVRAMNAYGTAYTSDFSREGRVHTCLATPQGLALSNLDGGQKLSWEKVSGAQLYRIYIKSGSTWQKLADTAELSHTLHNLRNNTVYTYTVRCLSADGRSFQSGFSSSGVSLRYFDMPVIHSAENTRSGAVLTWDKIDGVAKYRIFVREGTAWKKLGDVTGCTYTHADAAQGSTYIYTVRALDGSGRYISAYLAAGYTNLYQTAPLLRNVIPAAEDGTILAWSEFGEAQRYRVFRRTLDTQWKRIADVDGLTYTDSEAQKGVPCQYTLRCLDEEGNLTSDYYDNKLFYCDGVLCDGQINVNGYLVTFNKGKVTKGYLTAQDIIRIAQKEVGTKATNYKRCKYNTWYYGTDVSGDCYDWCVVFVEWVFNQAGARDLLYEKTAGAEIFGSYFYQHGRLVKSGYRVGDLVLLHWTDGYSDYVPGFKKLNHVGIVISVNGDGTYTTIEGNTGDSPNGEVCIKVRRADQISAAARPKYGFYIPAE